MRLLKLTATAVLGLTMLSACAGDSSENPEGDVSVKSCSGDPAGGKPKAEGSIVNNTSKASGYTFRVRFLDPSGNEVSQATNAVARVEPGETATWRVEGGTSARGALTCELKNVSRTAVET